MEITNAEPAKPATMPVTTKIPPPIIAPTFMAVALHNPRGCFSFFCSGSAIPFHFQTLPMKLTLLVHEDSRNLMRKHVKRVLVDQHGFDSACDGISYCSNGF